MFTIKHIHLSGEEEIIQADTVRYTPSPERYGSSQPGGVPPDTLWIREPGFDERPLTGGTIFVMNSMGKTVARYDLGASPVPIVGDGLSDPRHRGIGQGASIGERNAA